jgi:exosortase A-associated hydrolase 1
MTAGLESPEIFDCNGCRLFGILHSAKPSFDTGVVLLVGGPQYRVGAHRMFVDIARRLCAAGIPVLRFDFRGMGDSDGDFPGFENLDEDIDAAVTHFRFRSPDVKNVALLGLCDGATAAAIYKPGDTRVCARILLNPWVHSEAGEAKAYLWYYYPRRLLQRTFWASLLTGRVRVFRALGDFVRQSHRAVTGQDRDRSPSVQRFQDKMIDSLNHFDGHILVALSEHDLTAVEFRTLLASNRSWSGIRQRAHVEELKGADHTLSDTEHLAGFVDDVTRWIASVRD